MHRTLRVVVLVAILFMIPRAAAASIGSLSVPGGRAWLPLEIERVEVDVTIVGRLAQTTVRQAFRSHVAHRTQGRYSIQLPETAAISRLAMSVGPEIVEGELVERDRARTVYEGIVRSMRDPALLEWRGPGLFELSVFPIEPQERKVVVLRYEDVLPVEQGQATYRFQPVAALGEFAGGSVGRFEFRLHALHARIEGHNAQEFVREDLRGSGPIVVRNPLAEREVFVAPSTVGSHQFFADIALNLPPNTGDDVRGLVIAVDTSAAGGWDRLEYVQQVARALADAEHSRPLRVVSGAIASRACKPIATSPAQIVDECFAAMELRGATDLAQLLTASVEAAKALGEADIVLFSDGIPTAGPRDMGALTRIVSVAAPRLALFTVATGEPNLAVLRALADAGRGHVVSEPSAKSAVGRVREVLRARRTWRVNVRFSSGSALHLAAPQPRWVGPGDRVSVFGHSATPGAEVEFTARRGDDVRRRTIVVDRAGAVVAPDGVIEYAAARSQIRDLERRGVAPKRIVAESQRSGVMSRFTSYLVLENAAAFQTHGIERRKHAQRTTAPQIRMSAVTVMGSLDKEIIRRVIRDRRPQVRTCYEAALRRNAHASGTVSVAFRVENGRVTSARVERDAINDAEMQDCLLDVIRTLAFPTVPHGGLVTIHYPFTFQPSKPVDGEASPASDVEAALAVGNLELARTLLSQQLDPLAEMRSRAAADLRMKAFSSASVRAAFPQAFAAAAMLRLSHPHAPPGLHAALLEHLLKPGSLAELAKLPPPPPRDLRYVLSRAANVLAVEELRSLGQLWLAGLTPPQVVDALVGSPRLETLFVSQLAQAVADTAAPDDALIAALSEAARRSGQPQAATAVVIRRCAVDEADVQCIRWLRGLDGEAAAQLLAWHLRHRVRTLEHARRTQPGDSAVLTELSGYYADSGQQDRAASTRSEVAEFDPIAAGP